MKRVVRDVRQIQQSPLESHHIYYVHNEENMMEGHAMIVGPSDTPYFGGFYFFKLTFPNDYPFSPPTVTYLTNDGSTRFNPNLYTNGRVCVSILNTWTGEQWSPCQSISSVLLAICTLLNNNPLLNEPGVTDVEECDKYARIIHYKNLEFAVCSMLENKGERLYCTKWFYNDMVDCFVQNMSELLRRSEKENEVINTLHYAQHIEADYVNVKRRLTNLKTQLYDLTASDETKEN